MNEFEEITFDLHLMLHRTKKTLQSEAENLYFRLFTLERSDKQKKTKQTQVRHKMPPDICI